MTGQAQIVVGGYGLFRRRTLGSNPDSSLGNYKQPASQPQVCGLGTVHKFQRRGGGGRI